jgi:hypothetical protein
VENKVPDSPTIRPVDVDIVRVFEVSIAQMRAEDGWATLAEVGNTVIKLQPGFKPKHYGFKKLKDMADSIPGFEVEQMDGGVVRIRSLGVTEYDVAESEAGNDGSEEPKYGFDGDNVIQLVACG